MADGKPFVTTRPDNTTSKATSNHNNRTACDRRQLRIGLNCATSGFALRRPAQKGDLRRCIPKTNLWNVRPSSVRHYISFDDIWPPRRLRSGNLQKKKLTIARKSDSISVLISIRWLSSNMSCFVIDLHIFRAHRNNREVNALTFSCTWRARSWAKTINRRVSFD